MILVFVNIDILVMGLIKKVIEFDE